MNSEPNSAKAEPLFSFSHQALTRLEEDPKILDFSIDLLLDFKANRTLIKTYLRELTRDGKLEQDPGVFPLQKVRKTPPVSMLEHNYQSNVFRKALNRSQNLDLSASRIITEDRSLLDPIEKPSTSESNSKKPQTTATEEGKELSISANKNHWENIEFFSNNDEFNTLEKKKISGFESNYTFENNPNSISKLEVSLNYKSIEKNAENSRFFSPETAKSDNFEGFLQEFNRKTRGLQEDLGNANPKTQRSRNREEFRNFKEKSEHELKDIKLQMRSLESNLNSILDKLNQQIQNSKQEIRDKSEGRSREREDHSEGKSPLVEKKVLVVQKRKESLQPKESPLKTRVNRETHSLSKNMSPFCKTVLQEANVYPKTVGNPTQADEFNALNLFKSYEEGPEFKVSQFNMQDHLEVITKDVLRKSEDYKDLSQRYRGAFQGTSPSPLRKGQEFHRTGSSTSSIDLHKRVSVTPGRKFGGYN